MAGACTRVTMCLWQDERNWQVVEVECRYRPDDPFAVELDFGAAGQGVRWVVSRELLAAGLHGPVGEGDVHVEPADGTGVLIALRGRCGVALLSAPTAALDRFLAACELLVPSGAEDACIDWDRCIQDLLSA